MPEEKDADLPGRTRLPGFDEQSGRGQRGEYRGGYGPADYGPYAYGPPGGYVAGGYQPHENAVRTPVILREPLLRIQTAL